MVNDIEFESQKAGVGRPKDCYITLIGLPFPCGLKDYLTKSAFAFMLKQALEVSLQRLNWEDKNQYYERVTGDFYQDLYASAKRQAYLEEVFREMGDYRRSENIPVVVPIFPLIYDYEKYKWEYINERIVSLCKKNNLIPISLLESYRRYNYNDMRVQRGDFTHPSVKGNRVAAESIAQSLLTGLTIRVQAPGPAAPVE